jgi:hypothetical protein
MKTPAATSGARKPPKKTPAPYPSCPPRVSPRNRAKTVEDDINEREENEEHEEARENEASRRHTIERSNRLGPASRVRMTTPSSRHPAQPPEPATSERGAQGRRQQQNSAMVPTSVPTASATNTPTPTTSAPTTSVPTTSTPVHTTSVGPTLNSTQPTANPRTDLSNLVTTSRRESRFDKKMRGWIGEVNTRLDNICSTWDQSAIRCHSEWR